MPFLLHWQRRLQKTALSSPFLPNEAERFVEGFNPDERREWVSGIKTCLESSDLRDLITHRMYAVTSQDVFFLTTATARLQPMAITPNKANLSSETTCVYVDDILFISRRREERMIRLHAMFGQTYKGDFHTLFVGAESLAIPLDHF